MVDKSPFPFNLLSNDDLLTLLFQENQNVISAGKSVFDRNATNILTNNLDELNLEFNSHDDVSQLAQSPYFTEATFKDHLQTLDQNELFCFHVNIRSANRNFEKLRLFLNVNLRTAPIIGLSETWFTETTSSGSLTTLPDYNIVSNNRSTKSGGGVAIYVPRSIDYAIKKELKIMNDVIESLFVEITIENGKNILLGVIYKPPQSNYNDFMEVMNNILRNRSFQNRDCMIMGDFNINLLSNNNAGPDNFLDNLLQASLLPLISKPTRVTTHSSTLIDNIFTNLKPFPKSGIVVSDISDHFLIFAHFRTGTTCQNTAKKHALRRKFTPENITLLQEKLESTDWSDVYNENENIDQAYNVFFDILNNCLNTCIPLRKCRKQDYKRIPKQPWVSKTILRSINRKNSLYLNYIKNRTDNSRTKYISYKNILTNTLRLAKKKYYADQLSKFKSDIKSTWKLLNSVLNRRKVDNPISKLRDKDVIIEDKSIIAKVFNSYFSQIGSKLAKTVIPGDKSFHEFLTRPNDNSMFLNPTDRQELIRIVLQLKTNKAPGYDDIGNVLIKHIIYSIMDPLLFLLNFSLQSGQVPSKMKLAKVTPIFKKGDKLCVNNYRPISLLTSLSKILEKIIYSRTITFLQKHDIISNSQFGFREKHNTTHALLSLINTVSVSIEKSYHTIGMFLDFSKAFDTINHDILLHKLAHYGIRGKALQWFQSYLSDRKQFVTIGGYNSSTVPITCGVPQGSLLGPLLFSIYVNDIQNSSNVLSFILFADDSNLFYSNSDPNKLVENLNAELINVTNWIKANKLSLNIQKTNYMIFSNSIAHLPDQVIFDNAVIKEVQTTKFLGITIDNKLTWNYHIDNICKTISRNIGIINQVKRFLPKSVLLMLYSSLILPYLNYGVLAWGNAVQTRIDKLLLLQKRALRLICNASYRSHTDAMFRENRILKITDLYKLQLGCFMYNIDINDTPAVFKEMFQKNNVIHDYSTRQANDFHLPKNRTHFGNKTFMFTGPKMWNSLDCSLKQARNLDSFKYKLKKLFLERY